MMDSIDKNLLWYQFADDKGELQSLIFQNPIRVIQANCIDDVIPCFHKVMNAVKSNHYAAGFISYEAAPAFDPSFQVHSKSNMPLLWFGIFNHVENNISISSNQFSMTAWKPNVDKTVYERNIKKIKDYIKQGDTYQVNYTIRMESTFTGDGLSYFLQLSQAQTSNYSAYLNIGNFEILSASPELFFRRKGNQIITKPMKGTIKRGLTSEQDEKYKNWLYHSEKNRAENLMIVDLLRNDLGKIAIPGTVKVSKLFNIETYPTVHQMTSTITAEIDENCTIVDIFRALFPCGSITGAPKIKTMEIIEELEETPREVYCGAIGYIRPNGDAIFNVPIRTVTINKDSNKAIYGVGGGITWDSTSIDEYEEILTKANVLQEKRKDFQLLETILIDEGKCFLLTEHLQRLEKSANYFKFPLDIEKIKKELIDTASLFPQEKQKLRLIVFNTGEFQMETSPLLNTEKPKFVRFSDVPIQKENIFVYHKTTNRDVLKSIQEKNKDVYDIILWNEKGEITEFTNGNIILELKGKLLTPPVSSGLLPGTFRQLLINQNKISEAILTKDDVIQASRIWFINSVRKWEEVFLIQ